MGAMSIRGTTAHRGVDDLPPLVASAVAVAAALDFDNSCLPAQGRLLRVLAGGIGAGTIGETGTGCGVGLAWLASGAGPAVRLVSVDRDAARAAAAVEVFAGSPHDVRVLADHWPVLRGHGPFDLLVLDGGGSGKKHEPSIEPAEWLRPGGLLVVDDLEPMQGWPPRFGADVDRARLHWLLHPQLAAAEIRVAPDMATIVATYLGASRDGATAPMTGVGGD